MQDFSLTLLFTRRERLCNKFSLAQSFLGLNAYQIYQETADEMGSPWCWEKKWLCIQIKHFNLSKILLSGKSVGMKDFSKMKTNSLKQILSQCSDGIYRNLKIPVMSLILAVGAYVHTEKPNYSCLCKHDKSQCLITASCLYRRLNRQVLYNIHHKIWKFEKKRHGCGPLWT